MLRAARAERLVLSLPDQNELSPAQYNSFARSFGGRPDLHMQRHYCLDDHHEIVVVGNVENCGKKISASRVGPNWHTDHYRLPEPRLFTFPHAIIVPSVAGDTRYVNGIAALEALLQERGRETRNPRADGHRRCAPEPRASYGVS